MNRHNPIVRRPFLISSSFHYFSLYLIAEEWPLLIKYWYERHVPACYCFGGYTQQKEGFQASHPCQTVRKGSLTTRNEINIMFSQSCVYWISIGQAKALFCKGNIRVTPLEEIFSFKLSRFCHLWSNCRQILLICRQFEDGWTSLMANLSFLLSLNTTASYGPWKTGKNISI